MKGFELLNSIQKGSKRPKNRTRSKATRSRRRMILELDADARMRVFERDNETCLRCERKSPTIQWAHVLSRVHLCLRWQEDNAMTLCAGCHLKWHHEPAYAIEWFMDAFPDRWRRVKALHIMNPKVNVKSEFEKLKGVKPCQQ